MYKLRPTTLRGTARLVNTADIWEIRIQLGSDIFRVLGFFKTANEFIATNGFKKKSQKTPPQEIVLAETSMLIFIFIKNRFPISLGMV
jgi:phage-related protein